ncbi:MAG: glycosyltransferase family 9 protein [Frankia sp.]|nr:glycosyltransferase family 9 protein [Frankia sp.]
MTTAFVSHPAARTRRRLDLSAARRVLVIRPDNLGDVVLLTPALRALRAALPPGARVDLLATPAGAAVAGLVEGLDGVLEVSSVCWQDADGRPVDQAEQASLVRRLAAGHYDVAIVFTSFSESPWPAAYVCALAGIGVRAGASREFGGSLLTHWVDDLPDGLHQADRALALLQRLGVPTAGAADRALALRVPASGAARMARRWAPDGTPYAVLLPGATCPARRYPAGRFGQVGRALAAAGLLVIVAGTAREAELVSAVCRAARPAAGPCAPTAVAGARAPVVGLAGELGVAELAALLRGAAIVVTNNSGGAHLADAVRAPQVTLFAGTEREEEYRPRSGRSVVLRQPTPCAPCRSFVCRYQQECLDIPPGRVAAAALALARPTPEPAVAAAAGHAVRAAT